MEGQEDQGILASLRHYDAARLAASDSVVRQEGSNVDVFTDPTDGKQVALCHFSTILPFTNGGYNPFRLGFEDSHSIALAIQHLNTGDGSIVPELDGLNDRCPVRFTAEFADTEFVGGATLKHVVEQTSREDPTERLPCAFIGAYRSAVSIPSKFLHYCSLYSIGIAYRNDIATNSEHRHGSVGLSANVRGFEQCRTR